MLILLPWLGFDLISRRRQAGFGLLEVLITLVIVAIAGGSILTHMQTITDYNLRMQAHLADINALQNQIASFMIHDLTNDEVRLAGDHLEIVETGKSEPMVHISNFSPNPIQVPISLGYTPYQLYTWSSPKRHVISLIMPSLRPKKH